MIITASDGWILRQVEAKDAMRWAEMFIDWPRDARGGRSVSRGIREVDFHIKHASDFYYPLVVGGMPFELAMIYADPDDIAVGAYRIQTEDDHYTILNYAIHPSRRGEGLSSRMTHQWNWFSQRVLEAPYSEYEIFDDAPGAMANSVKFDHTVIGQRVGIETGKAVTRVRTDAAGVDAQRALPGPRITYTKTG